MARTDAARIEQAIRFLESRVHEQPSLAETAAAIGLSDTHFHRLFKRWAGVSPKRFLQFLTAEHARRLLDGSRSVLDAAWDAGLSGPGRLHDLTVNVHALTPGELQRGGDGLTVRYGCHPSPFGECLLALTERGVCGLAFVAVWEALLRVPEGALVSYANLARAVGTPQGARAVGSAVARNPIAFLIPCHRVIRSTGVFGAYRWGSARKKVIVGWEAARAARVHSSPAPQ